ncbi:MAG TPA: SGNH/GDSL hydrolase family protein [Gemmatimonadaceae bacterium]|nr:SGNH/GDSL hydrolase family protein [Gemmatimonadaceae bacterium]
MRRYVKSLLFPLAAAALGLVFAVAIAELTLRALSLAPSDAISTVTESEFRRVPGIFGPGQQIVDRQLAALPFAVRIDSLGFRGVDFPVRKRAGELRILSVGDSFTYGDFVDNDSTFPAVLERDLTASCSRPVTVINAGVGGSTITTAVHMVDRAWGLSPDVVLLTFVENDIDDLRNDMWGELAANRKAKSKFPLSVIYPALRRSALWNFSLKLRGRVRAVGFSSLPTATADPRSRSDVPVLRAKYSHILDSLAKSVRGRDRSFVLAAFPSHLTMSGITTTEQLRWLEGTGKDHGVPTFNLFSPLHASGLPTTSLYLLPYDGHPSPHGYEIAGAWLASQLASMGLCRTPE